MTISQEIVLNADIVKLGGELGAGGGAIGLSARGGAGGPVYVLDVESGDLIRRDVATGRETEKPASDASTMPMIGTLLFEGFDGQPGGTTSIGKADGSVIIAAGGGGPGFVGTGNRSISDRLGVSALMFADYVHTYASGVCSVIHGGLGGIVVESFPAGIPAALIVCEAGGVPVGEYAVHVTLRSPSGARVARSTLVFTVEVAGELCRSPFYVPLVGEVTDVGLHQLEVASDLRELHSISLFVRQADQ
jgi:hypothetical protein